MSRLISLIFLALPLYLLRFEVAGVPTTALEVLIWALFVAGFVQGRWWSPKSWSATAHLRPRIDRATLIGISGLLLAGIVSLFVTPDLRAGLGLYKGFIVTPLLAFILLRAYGRGHVELYWRAYTVSALVLAGWGILEWILAAGSGYRTHGPFESPNYLAFYLVPVVFFLLYRVVEVVSHVLRALHVAELAIVLTALLMTGSRGAYLGLAAGFFVWIPYLFGKLAIWQRLIASLGMGLSAFLVFATLLLYQDRAASSDDIRRIVWSRAWELIQANPILGVGLGGFHQAFVNLSWPILDVGHMAARDVSNPHNLYFTLWLNVGLLGLLALIWLVLAALRQAWRVRAVPLAWVTLSVLAAILVHGIVDTPIWKNDLAVIFWLVVATPWLVTHKQK
jgi:O-antigen ligase